METRQTFLHQSQHPPQYQLKQGNREKNEKIWYHTDPLSLPRKKRFSPLNSHPRFLEKTIAHKRVQKPNGNYLTQFRSKSISSKN